jgi:hypothetical protein
MILEGQFRPFWRDTTVNCDPKYARFFESLSYPRSLCAGIWGGARGTVLQMLRELTNGIISERESNRNCHLSTDQTVFDFMALTTFADRLVNFYSCNPGVWYRGRECRLNMQPYEWFPRTSISPLLVSEIGLVGNEWVGRDDVLMHRAVAFFCPIAWGPRLDRHDMRWWQPGNLQGDGPQIYQHDGR